MTRIDANTTATDQVSGTATTRQTLLSTQFMRQLDRLDVLSRKILAGTLPGERRSKRRGQSVEFADYRNYVAGDDLRFIDWNLYARLDRLFLRLFMEEEDLSVSIVLDTSASMDFGSTRKSNYGKQLAAALGYVGLVNQNRVSMYGFADSIEDELPNMRGRRPIPQMLDFLARQQSAGAGDLVAACRQFAMAQRAKGVVILISDFLEKGDLTEALRYLRGDRYDVYALQVLAPEELDPVKANLAGDLRLRDVEDGDVAEVSISAALLKRYKATVQAYCQHVRDLCVRRDITYLMTDTAVPFEQVVLRYLRQRGLLG